MDDFETWQEVLCPNTGLDYDLEGIDMVNKWQVFYCHACIENHIAGDWFIQMYERWGDELTVVPLPSGND